jgi:pantothenate kinase
MNEEHTCYQEDKIERLIKWVDGNGKPGLREEVIHMKGKLDNVDETMKGLATNMSALVKAVSEMQTIDSMRQKRRMNAWQRTSIFIAAIVGISTVIIKVLDYLKS